MSKKIFTEQEILELSKNKYVKNVTAKGITYTKEGVGYTDNGDGTWTDENGNLYEE